MVHLFFLVHGFAGKKEDMSAMRAHLENACSNPDSIKVYQAAGHEFVKTLDSIKVGAQRVYRELLAECDDSIDRISFIGYSMGGLVTRALIGILDENDFWNSTGVKRGFFASFATPHLGARRVGHGGVKEAMFNFLGISLLGVSGREMFQEGSSGIVAELADPNGLAYQGLAKFHPLVLVANAADDRSVKFWTSFITTKEPFADVHAVDFVFFDQPGGHNEDPDFPLLDLPECKHITDEKIIEENRGNETESSRLTWRFYLLVIPVATVVLSVMSTRSALRRLYMSHHWRHSFLKAVSHQKEIASKRQSEPSSDVSSVAGPREKAFSKAVQNAIENPEAFAHPDESGHETRMNANNYPKPLIGTCDFVESSPSEANLTKAKREQIANLNKLPWRKYVARFRSHTWTHAEIVNRHQREGGQGNEMLAYFADLFHTFYSDHDASSTSQPSVA